MQFKMKLYQLFIDLSHNVRKLDSIANAPDQKAYYSALTEIARLYGLIVPQWLSSEYIRPSLQEGQAEVALEDICVDLNHMIVLTIGHEKA
jgi:hypothetical protein